ncbi:MAG: glycosyl hydrolase [Acidobacteria bacterium]|nr:glycosyl hydrolase [Acidobacteriota bacterium]
MIRPSTLRPALVLTLAFASPPADAAAARPAAKPPAPAAFPDEAFQALQYRLVGPFRGGRSTAVAGVVQDPRTFYMGTTGGGVWKTTDGGLTWRNVTDRVREEKPQPPARPMGEGAPPEPARGATASETRVRAGDQLGSASVGAIAVAPSDPNVVYVGMGSACIRGNVSAGDGAYKSTDAGATWWRIGLADAGQIGRIQVHPTNPDLVYVAVLGHAFGPNTTRGIFRSKDGGQSWQRVLYVGDRAGAVDLALDPTNPRILYAATWEALRQPWTFVSGGPGSGLWKSADGGDTWRPLTEGLPEGTKGRIGVAVSPAQPSRVWALVEHAEKGGLYRSDDGGKSFRQVGSDRNLVTRAWYYTHVYADPKDANTVYVLNVSFWRSDDGGKTFVPIRTPHGDNHDLWIHPEHPEVMIEANDGGSNVTTNGGRTWTAQENQPTAEMYRATVDDQFPYWIYGGQQDNSAVAIPSQAPGGGIGRDEWYVPGGCESATVAVDPRDPNVTYAGCYGGSIGRYDRRTVTEREVMVWPQMAVGQKPADLKYRFQWNTPIRISAHDPSVLYATSNHVHRSRDEGQSWEEASPDLTRDDPAKQESSGGPLTKDNTGVEVYGTIFAFEESRHAKGELWAGSDDGWVHVSRDDGKTWANVTPPGLPEWGTVNMIELSGHQPGRAFLAVHRYRLDDFRPYVFRTNDGGVTWEALTSGTNGIAAGHFVRVIREDPERRGLLYAGTEYGVYVSLDDGRSWQSLQLNLPVSPVTDLAVKNDDLVVATQGRSYWILDDVTPLRQMTAQVASSRAHLFTPRAAVDVEGAGSFTRPGEGKNPPRGAILYYQLGEDLSEKGKAEARLEILDAAGDVLRTLSSQKEEYQAPSLFRQFFPELFEPRKLPAKKGLNRFVWDFRLADAEVVDKAVLWGSPNGPEVAPGTYRARLTVGDWTSTVSFEVRGDPRNKAPREDREAAFRLARDAWRALGHTHAAIRRIQSVRQQVDDLVGRLEAAGRGDGVADAAKPVQEKLTAVEEKLWQPKNRASQDILNFPPQLDNQLLYLQNVVESARGTPTAQSVARFAELQAQLDGHLAELDRTLGGELVAFNDFVRGKGATPVLVPRNKQDEARK